MATYQQKLKPDLGVQVQALLCLNFTWRTFGSRPGMGFSYALQAWKGQKKRHRTKPPAGVYVPIWFSWVGTVDGVRKDWGHAAVSMPDGRVLSSPMSGFGRTITTIAELESRYGMRYLGWSEYMDYAQVVTKVKGVYTKRLKKTMNVRAEPSTTSRVIAVRKRGTPKRVSTWTRGQKVGGSDVWLRVNVRVKGKLKTGWIHSSGFVMKPTTLKRLKEIE